MKGVIEAQFVDVQDMTYVIDGQTITTHYIIVVDEDATIIGNRYVNIKVKEKAFKDLGLNVVAKVKEFVGKTCQFHGNWVKESKSSVVNGQKVLTPTWVFQVKLIK